MLFDIAPNHYGKSAFLDIAPINQPALKRYVEQFRQIADLLNKNYIVFPMMMGCRIRRAAALAAGALAPSDQRARSSRN